MKLLRFGYLVMTTKIKIKKYDIFTQSLYNVITI